MLLSESPKAESTVASLQSTYEHSQPYLRGCVNLTTANPTFTHMNPATANPTFIQINPATANPTFTHVNPAYLGVLSLGDKTLMRK